MAKKETSSRSSRVLTKTFPATLVAISADETQMPYPTGWEETSVTVGANTYTIIYRIQSWDLSGYSLQDKTLFPQGVVFQDASFGPESSPSSPLHRATIVSATPINADDLSNIGAWGEWTLPGMPGSGYELDNIILGRLQYYLTLTTAVGVQLRKESTWGSGSATAGEKMWVCDAYMTIRGANGGIYIPDSAVVMPAMVDKEAELEYLMRLSRSLEPVY